MSSEYQEPPNLHLDLMLERVELSLQAAREVRVAIGTTALESAEVPEILRARIRDAARVLGRAAVDLGGIAAPPEPQHQTFTDEEMFQKIVTPQIRRPRSNVETHDLIEIVIESDTTLIIRGEHITLSPHQLFIFNHFITTPSAVNKTRDFVDRLLSIGYLRRANTKGGKNRRYIMRLSN